MTSSSRFAPFLLGGNEAFSLRIQVVDAQQQRRTPRDVKGEWIRPRVPSKRAGRKGTRKGWKRLNPPHHVMLYREPDDALIYQNRLAILTPRQAQALEEATKPAPVHRALGDA